MSQYSFLVIDGELPDLTYRTDSPEEVISPRVVEEAGHYFTYCKKVQVPLADFLRRLAYGEEGLWVAGYRNSKGKKVQSTITFSKRDRVRMTPRLQQVLEEIRTSAVTALPVTAPALQGLLNQESGRGNANKPPVSLADLEERLKKQAEVGIRGERAAYRHEFLRLMDLGCADPSAHIKHVSMDDVAAGYDLRSEFAGELRCIEVKASVSRTDTFFISENERVRLTALGTSAFIYLVRVDEQDDTKSYVMREIPDPFGSPSMISLEPTAWFATLTDEKVIHGN